MKILITGGSGYIGSILTPMLLQEGYQVRVFDNLQFQQSSMLPHFINKNFEMVKGDMRDLTAVKSAVSGVDVVIHLAAMLGAPVCNANPKLAEEVNVQGTINLDSARSSDQPVLYASTGSNYGKVEGICTEETPLNPLSVYGVTKTKAETILRESGNMIGYRFATAFGLSPRLRLDLMPNDFVFQALRVGNLIVYQKNMQRTFIHVYDIARSFLHALKNYEAMKDHVYNVGDESMNTTKGELAQLIKDRLDYYLHFAEIGSDPDMRDYEVSYEKIRNTGFKTSITLEEGVEEMINGLQLIQLDDPYRN